MSRATRPLSSPELPSTPAAAAKPLDEVVKVWSDLQPSWKLALQPAFWSASFRDREHLRGQTDLIWLQVMQQPDCKAFEPRYRLI